jgi:hypothetical protein
VADVISIDLQSVIPPRGAIRFVRAELPRSPRPALVLVRYSRWGVEQATGLRLDLDKRVFIDQFDGNPEDRQAFESGTALQIASHVSNELRQRAS